MAQLLGLVIAILLLTNIGRLTVAKFGLAHVLLGALVFFVIAEVAIVAAVIRYQVKSTSISTVGQTPATGSSFNPERRNGDAST